MTDEATRAIDALIDRYNACFNRQDFEGALACYALPFTWIFSKARVSVSDEQQFLDTMRATTGRLRAKGLARSVFAEKHVRLLDAHVAVASTLCIRYRADGTEMERVAGTYFLHENEGGWKLIACAGHPPETMLPSA